MVFLCSFSLFDPFSKNLTRSEGSLRSEPPFLFFFSRAVFRVAPQLTKRLEETTTAKII